MKGFGKSFLMAFSGYSISPKAKLEKNKDNCSFILLFVPIVGLIITVIINRWAVLYPYMCDHPVLPAIVGAVIPTLLSGGVHLEGFFKTVDAISSHKTREEKLRIIKEDAHGGYSALVACICYFMILFGIWSEMPIDGIFVIAFEYVIARALYSISILTMKHVNGSKCDCYVPDSKFNKIFQILVNIGYIAICAVLMVNIAQSFEMISVAIAAFAGAAIAFLFYVCVAFKHFGGITEENAGFFVTMCEMIIPIAVLFAFKSPI